VSAGGRRREVPDAAAGNAGPRAAGAATGSAHDPGDDLLVCRCEEVSRAEILAAVDEGITTVSGLRRRLRIGMGLCQGRTCRRLLAPVLAERLGEEPADVRPGTFRPPVRPVSLRALADEREAPLPAPAGDTPAP
jgi:bacterioferritin-associated ferredoxin